MSRTFVPLLVVLLHLGVTQPAWAFNADTAPAPTLPSNPELVPCALDLAVTVQTKHLAPASSGQIVARSTPALGVQLAGLWQSHGSHQHSYASRKEPQ